MVPFADGILAENQKLALKSRISKKKKIKKSKKIGNNFPDPGEYIWRSETTLPFYGVELRPKNQVHLAIKSEFLSQKQPRNGQICETLFVAGAQKQEYTSPTAKKSRD